MKEQNSWRKYGRLEIKSGKAPGLDGFPVECLKKGGMAVLESLVRLLNLSFDMGLNLWTGVVLV